jgi:DNA polymerase III subunit delta'
VRSALTGSSAERRWLGLLDAAREAGVSAGERAQERLARELELLPQKERRRSEREGLDARRRNERRTRTRTLDLGLRLSELWLRDVMCVCEGAAELVYAVDRRPQLEHDARDRDGARVRAGVELVADTRMRLPQNVSEELALEALAYRLESLLVC